MSKGLIATLAVLGAIVLAVLIVGGSVISARNRLVTMDEAINGQWSQVENQLQRRNDLIPNLVNTVKGYASHEKEIFENIAAARAKMAGARTKDDTIDGANQMSGALSRLLMVVERYPDLKANQNFRDLQNQLEGTENRINVARQRYNQSVEKFNFSIRKFPNSLTNSLLLHLERKEYFKAEEGTASAPKVKFTD
jgi:LemA protein